MQFLKFDLIETKNPAAKGSTLSIMNLVQVEILSFSLYGTLRKHLERLVLVGEIKQVTL